MQQVTSEARTQADTALVAMATAAAAALEDWAKCTQEMSGMTFGPPPPKDADLAVPEEACKVLAALEHAIGVLQEMGETY